jgi:NADPH:quinone reductase-like Zn-dependent oxidoreductase
MPVKETRQWTVQGQTGFDDLKFNPSAPVPKLGDHDVLVKIRFASLNFRDLVILKVCKIPISLLGS